MSLQSALYSDSNLLETYTVDGETLIQIAPIRSPMTPHVIEKFSGLLKEYNGYALYSQEQKDSILQTIKNLQDGVLTGNSEGMARLFQSLVREIGPVYDAHGGYTQRHVRAKKIGETRTPSVVRPGWFNHVRAARSRIDSEFGRQWNAIIDRGRRL